MRAHRRRRRPSDLQREEDVSGKKQEQWLPRELQRKVAALLDAASVRRWQLSSRGLWAAELSAHPELARTFAAVRVERVRTTSQKTEEDRWRHEHNSLCSACGLGGEILCCDYCNLSYHLGCLSPPLAAPPTEGWSCPACAAEDGGPLLGNVAAFLSEERRLAIVGGFQSSSFVANAGARVYELHAAREWRAVTLQRPSDASFDFCGHATVLDGKTLRAFARRGPRPVPGASPATRSRASAATFETACELRDRRWHHHATLGDVPSPRVDAALCDDGDRLLLSGGYCTDTRRRLAGLYALTKATYRWRRLAPDATYDDACEGPPAPAAAPTSEEQQQQQEEGKRRRKPKARFDDQEFPKSTTNRRRRVVLKKGPGALSGHSLTRVGAAHLFGGLGDKGYGRDVWRLVDDVFRKLACSGTPPRGRAGHASAAVGPHLLVFGGVHAKSFLNDLFVLNTAARAWSHPALQQPSQLPSPRMHASLVRSDNDLLLFGGSRSWGIDAYMPITTQVLEGDLFRIQLLADANEEEGRQDGLFSSFS